MANYIGFDIGGTKIRFGLVRNSKIIKKITRDTPHKRKEFLAVSFECIQELVDGNIRISGIGVGAKGAIDRLRGTIMRVPVLSSLNGLDLKEAIKDKFKIPVRIDNDSKCFMMAEARFGAARRVKNAVGLIIGTGIGAGIMIDRKIYYGRGAAGEIGHAIIRSSVKNKNSKIVLEEALSFENLASKQGFMRLGIRDPRRLFGLAKSGDKRALEIFAVIGAYLGIGLANVINIFDPEMIVLGGGIAHSHRFFLPSAKKAMQKIIFSPQAKRTPIVISKLGDDAGMIGAALLFSR